MAYKHATYEEYEKASRFARFRYRFGVYIQLLALILFIFLIIFTVTNVEEMKSNPIDFAQKKMGVVCYYPDSIYISLGVNNGSNRDYQNP